MSTTVFITRCWKNARLDLAALGVTLVLMLSLAMAMAAGPARADTAAPEITQMRVERTDEGVYLTAAVRFDLSPVVEDALLKGVPMYFVAEADLYRERWYWYDRKVASASRHMRLAYQPLVRRWRLNVSPAPISNAGLGVTFYQSYDSLDDAIAAIQRISRWKIAEATEMDPEARHSLEFRFRLDVSQLPRPFQIGAVGQPDWNIAVGRTQRLVWDSAK